MTVIFFGDVMFSESNLDHNLMQTLNQNFEDITCLSEFRKEKEKLQVPKTYGLWSDCLNTCAGGAMC